MAQGGGRGRAPEARGLPVVLGVGVEGALRVPVVLEVGVGVGLPEGVVLGVAPNDSAGVPVPVPVPVPDRDRLLLLLGVLLALAPLVREGVGDYLAR